MSTTTNGTPTVTKTTKASPSKSGKRDTDFPALPPAPAPHVFGTGYSGKHKVPKAQDWQQINERHQQQADEYARIMEMREQAQQDEDRLAEEGPTSEEEGEPAYVQVDGDGDPVNPQDSPTTAGNKVSNDGTQSRKKADPKNAANEKQRLMNQMTSFTGKLSSPGQADSVQRNRPTASRRLRRESAEFVTPSRAESSWSRTQTRKVRAFPSFLPRVCEARSGRRTHPLLRRSHRVYRRPPALRCPGMRTCAEHRLLRRSSRHHPLYPPLVPPSWAPTLVADASASGFWRRSLSSSCTAKSACSRCSGWLGSRSSSAKMVAFPTRTTMVTTFLRSSSRANDRL